MVIPSIKGPINCKKSSHQRRTWWRSHMSLFSSTTSCTCSSGLPSSYWSKDASYLVHKRLGPAALSLCGSSWHSQERLDLLWHFSWGQPESEVLIFCHFFPCGWPSGLGQTHPNACKHQLFAWDTLVILQWRQGYGLHDEVHIWLNVWSAPLRYAAFTRSNGEVSSIR